MSTLIVFAAGILTGINKDRIAQVMIKIGAGKYLDNLRLKIKSWLNW